MKTSALSYHLCPHCHRAIPAAAGEVYCPNDGTKLLTACPRCLATIASPYSRFCSQCGYNFATSQVAGKENS